MRKSPIARSLKDIHKLKKDGFIITGYLKSEINTKILPDIEIELLDSNVKIEKGFKYYLDNSDSKIIRAGSTVSIYSALNKINNQEIINGYELYPGTPEQYINFLSSPYNSYMVYVRVFIGLAIIFFLFSIVLNIRK